MKLTFQGCFFHAIFQGVNISKPFEAWLYDDYIKAIF
nr:MAG TPA: hypothetical protein [Caudoviricetes sp.]